MQPIEFSEMRAIEVSGPACVLVAQYGQVFAYFRRPAEPFAWSGPFSGWVLAECTLSATGDLIGLTPAEVA